MKLLNGVGVILDICSWFFFAHLTTFSSMSMSQLYVYRRKIIGDKLLIGVQLPSPHWTQLWNAWTWDHVCIGTLYGVL